MVTTTRTGMCRAHTAQFYNLMPRGINCLAFNKMSHKLALSRDDGSIEIWNLSASPFMEKNIAGGNGVSVEGIAWAGNRLFTVGLSGSLIEWDLKKLEPRNTVLMTGNAAWCIDVSRDETKIAIGTEGGYINVFNVDDDTINYEKILDKQEGRVVCCKFDYSGDFLVTGSADAVRIWNIRNGHAVHKMTIGRLDVNKETMVWTVIVLRDFTIISGDSRGKITFYDGHLGATIESISVSKADILAIVADEEEKTLFLSGVEPIIRSFQRIDVVKKSEKIGGFVRAVSRNVHTHDTKTLTMNGNQLISGGNDGNLVISSYPPKEVNKYLPYLGAPSTILAQKSRLVLLKYVNYLEVWRLGTASYTEEKFSNQLNLEEGSQKLLQIRSKNDEHIACCSISSDGQWIIYSTDVTMRLFKFEMLANGGPRLIQIKTIPEQFSTCWRVDFTHNSKGVFLFKNDGVIDYFTFNQNDDFDHKQSISTGKWIQDKIHLATVSRCGKYLVVASLCNLISVWKMEPSGKWKHSINLPRYRHPATAIAFKPDSSLLTAVFPDNKIFQYDLEEFEFKFSSFLNFKQMSHPKHVVSDIAFDPRNENIMLLQRDSSVTVLKFDPDMEGGNDKVSKDDTVSTTSIPYELLELKKYTHLVNIFWLNTDEFVAIEANPVSMTEHIPAAFRRKIYGVA